MRAVAAVLAFAAFAAATPQAVTSAIAPSSTPEAGCSPNYDGSFAIALVDANTKRHLEKRQEDAEGALGITLQDGVLKDQDGWTGYVASNSQLQFDNPPQAGAIYTAGFAICQNGHLAIGDDDTWYKCLSGTFFNIYLDNVLDAGQCTEVYIEVTPLDGSSGVQSSASVTSTRTRGQGTATATPAVSSSSVAGNSTMIMSSSGAAGNGTAAATTTTRRTGTSTTRTGGGAMTETSDTTTGGSSQHTGGSGSGSQGESSSSTGAAGLPTARADVLGMAVGLLAMAAL